MGPWSSASRPGRIRDLPPPPEPAASGSGAAAAGENGGSGSGPGQTAGGPWADPVAALETDLTRLGGRSPLARAMLAALAWAQGPGLPGSIWVGVAGTPLTGEWEARAVTRRHVRWLLRTLPGYVMTGHGAAGQTAYRLRDGGLAAHLRGEPGERDEPGAERRITAALLAAVPAAGPRRDWPRADPYLRAYLALHAADAGPEYLAALVRDPDFLAAADPGAITPVLSVACPGTHDTVRAYRR